jgi:hypothetical protein
MKATNEYSPLPEGFAIIWLTCLFGCAIIWGIVIWMMLAF